METEQIYVSAALMPDFPRYQAYLESVARMMPAPAGNRCAALVHQGVLGQRAMRIMGIFCEQMPDGLVEFIAQTINASLYASIEYACVQRRRDEIINHAFEAYKIFREEEDQMQKRQIMLDQLDTTYRLPN